MDYGKFHVLDLEFFWMEKTKIFLGWIFKVDDQWKI